MIKREPIYIDFGKTLPVAHRGLSAIERENTLPAFIAAANRPYFGIETDIHMTADGKIICCHDSNTARVAGGDGMIIEETTFDTLRSLILTDIDGVTRRVDLHLPTLAEYITVCRDYGKQCILELKGVYTTEMLTETVGIIRALDYLDGVTFIAFDYESLVRLRELLPTQSAQFLISKWDDGLIDRLKAYGLDLDIHHSALTEERIALLHENGITVNCWTVDESERAAQLIEWGVDQITSNRLAPRF